MICELAISTAMTCGGMNTTRGESEAAQYVAKQARDGMRQVRGSYCLGAGLEEIFTELCSVAENCASPNWDGYGAAPITSATYHFAFRFLESLPLGFALPSVGVEPDGQVTFEWYRNPRRTLSVSIDGSGDLHYAALLGHNKAYGTEALISGIPGPILDLVHRVLTE